MAEVQLGAKQRLRTVLGVFIPRRSKRWQALGRQVRKGETGTAILAPILSLIVRRVKDEDEGQVVGFRSARVFDVLQTGGEPLPDVPQPVLLTDDGEAVQAALVKAEALATAKGFPVVCRQLHGRALGSFSVAKRVIKVRADLPPLQTLKTLVYPAHGLMHADPKAGKQRHLVELKAESYTFLVLHELGLDTSRYTFPYPANWAEHRGELLRADEKAVRVAQRAQPSGCIC